MSETDGREHARETKRKWEMMEHVWVERVHEGELIKLGPNIFLFRF
jgi:hypothetical protein